MAPLGLGGLGMADYDHLKQVGGGSTKEMERPAARRAATPRVEAPAKSNSAPVLLRAPGCALIVGGCRRLVPLHRRRHNDGQRRLPNRAGIPPGRSFVHAAAQIIVAQTNKLWGSLYDAFA